MALFFLIGFKQDIKYIKAWRMFAYAPSTFKHHVV
jgi:hypothetical protein